MEVDCEKDVPLISELMFIRKHYDMVMVAAACCESGGLGILLNDPLSADPACTVGYRFDVVGRLKPIPHDIGIQMLYRVRATNGYHCVLEILR